jgi:glycosyltransferase involved in cell wall biosynthesis
MLTTFFGAHSFGGDAAFVDRLARTLARHGHEVHVIHCRDAFEVSRGGQSPIPYEPPPGVQAHALRSPFSALSPLATHQTGRPLFKARAIRRLVRQIRPDVLHVHNLSLIGGPGLLALPAPGAVKLMTAHEHWLVCPLSVLWKLDAGVCEAPQCVRCCVKARRPPQLWRKTSLLDRSLRHLDALICPSRSTQYEHARRGLMARTVHLPYFLPDDYPGRPPAPTPRHPRPYVAAAGRLEKIKGFQDAIDAVRRLPHVDLRIAGTGGFEAALRAHARGLDNVHFEGRLDAPRLAALFRGARAVVVPSLVYETFGYVVLEAFHEATPVVVRNLGALPELVEESRGGLVFDTTEEMTASLDRLVRDAPLRDALGANGRRARRDVWSEPQHLDRYFDLIDRHRRARRVRSDAPSTPLRSPSPIPRHPTPIAP